MKNLTSWGLKWQKNLVTRLCNEIFSRHFEGTLTDLSFSEAPRILTFLRKPRQDVEARRGKSGAKAEGRNGISLQFQRNFYLYCLLRTCPVCIWFNEYIFQVFMDAFRRATRGKCKISKIVITFENVSLQCAREKLKHARHRETEWVRTIKRANLPRYFLWIHSWIKLEFDAINELELKIHKKNMWMRSEKFFDCYRPRWTSESGRSAK